MDCLAVTDYLSTADLLVADLLAVDSKSIDQMFRY